MRKGKVIFFKQPDQMDCGPTCLKMIAKYYGRSISLEKIRRLSETTREGSSLKNIADSSEKIGFRSFGAKLSFNKLANDVPLPCIVHWKQNHFVVVYEVKKDKVLIADPANDIITFNKSEFILSWIGNHANDNTEEGVALLLEPTSKLLESEYDDIQDKVGFKFLYKYLFQYKKFIFQLVIGLVAGSILQLFVPFLTQSIVDIGINNYDLNFIYLILIAQVFLFLGRISIEIIRGWILLHLSTRINIALISDFFIKLMNLPIAFFDSKMTGDIMQRISDHQRIENLLTASSLDVLFSLFNLVIFGAVLAWYNFTIFFVFLIGSIFYFLWVILFLKKRKKIDYKRFALMGDEQSKVIELINGMQEIKLHNAEREKRWSWENIQVKLFKIEIKNLSLLQTQSVGSSFINELKNILITILSAKLVIEGQITLGMMMAITYIIGQLNSPIQQLIGFVYKAQDAKIALERLSEIHKLDDEENINDDKINNLPIDSDIKLHDVTFRYNGVKNNVLKGINLTIPSNKVTAIVGASGSGKTTLMKILLKFYEPRSGEIKIGEYNLNNISQNLWRNKCGVVMQEGFIFEDTIANNITIGQDRIDYGRLVKAVEIANIKHFIDELPLGFNTKIGAEGMGMSSGQKQRLLIARSVYKNPDIIFFDEATSALDAKNEKIIMENLNLFFENKTVIIIAHRLSTVKNADQIVVVDDGEIIEKGTHRELVKLGGSYYSLVKDQLQLEKLNAR